jgi:hypothetical protein
MNLFEILRNKIIPALREVFGVDEVQCGSDTRTPGVSGYIKTADSLADVYFGIDQISEQIVLTLDLNSVDFNGVSHVFDDPTLIYDLIVCFVKDHADYKQVGRTILRAAEFELNNGTLTGVNPKEYLGTQVSDDNLSDVIPSQLIDRVIT